MNLDRAMGEAKKKLLSTLRTQGRCIYCPNPSVEVEHMPPRAMFKRKDRPKGLEFGICSKCNRGTRDADLLACFLSRAEVTRDSDIISMEEIKGFYKRLRYRLPELNQEFEKAEYTQTRLNGPFLGLKNEMVVKLDNPKTKRYLTAFATKLGMAMYAHHIGNPLPAGGGVVSFWMTGRSASSEQIDAILSILPMYNTLKQGIKVVNGQFEYRYNCDNKSVVASFANFHNGLFVFTICSDNPIFLELPHVSVTSGIVKMGGIVRYMAAD